MTSLFSSSATEGRDTIMVSGDFHCLMTLCPMFVPKSTHSSLCLSFLPAYPSAFQIGKPRELFLG